MLRSVRSLPLATLRRIALTGTIAVSAILAACSADRVAAPQPFDTPVHAAMASDAPRTTVTGVQRDTPLPQNVTRSFLVRRNGGTGVYEWPEMGLKVLVPDRSFPQKSITITITALAGSVIAYDFGPDGQMFSEPLTIIQSLKGTNYQRARSGLFRGAYFRTATDINQASGTAQVLEFQPTEMDVQGQKVTFKVNHFSGYMVSMD